MESAVFYLKLQSIIEYNEKVRKSFEFVLMKFQYFNTNDYFIRFLLDLHFTNESLLFSKFG